MDRWDQKRIEFHERKNRSWTLSWREQLFKDISQRCQQKLRRWKSQLCGIPKTINALLLRKYIIIIKQSQCWGNWTPGHQRLDNSRQEKGLSNDNMILTHYTNNFSIISSLCLLYFWVFYLHNMIPNQARL